MPPGAQVAQAISAVGSAGEARVRILVRAQPRASRSLLVGVMDVQDERGRAAVALKIAVAAPPVEGAANQAIVALLADLLSLPKRAVAIARGETGRNKQVEVSGLTVEQVVDRLARALAKTRHEGTP